MQFQICEDNHNAKVLQLDLQHEILKFQDSLIYYENIRDKIVKVFIQMCKMLNIYYKIHISVMTL